MPAHRIEGGGRAEFEAGLTFGRGGGMMQGFADPCVGLQRQGGGNPAIPRADAADHRQVGLFAGTVKAGSNKYQQRGTSVISLRISSTPAPSSTLIAT